MRRHSAEPTRGGVDVLFRYLAKLLLRPASEFTGGVLSIENSNKRSEGVPLRTDIAGSRVL